VRSGETGLGIVTGIHVPLTGSRCVNSAAAAAKVQLCRSASGHCAMQSHSAFALFLVIGLTACQSRPPVELSPSLVASPDLSSRSPVNVAVLPVEDATPGQVLEPYLGQLRDDIAFALGRRLYSPLAISMVDAKISPQQVGAGSTVDAAFVKGFAGECEEDAILGVRMTRWDERSIMDDGRVSFAAEVLMLATDGARLWSGRVDGSVKAGGDGPAPLARQARSRSAISVFAQALIEQLPKRR